MSGARLVPVCEAGHNGANEPTREAAMAAFAKELTERMRPFLQTPMGISARLRGCLMGADTNQPEVSAYGPWPGRIGRHRRGAAGNCRRGGKVVVGIAREKWRRSQGAGF